METIKFIPYGEFITIYLRDSKIMINTIKETFECLDDSVIVDSTGIAGKFIKKS